LSLRYLSYQEIDKTKWDQCIRKSVNGLIYAESVYLDHIAAHWDGIVLNNYEAVMPLTWKKKLGIKYLYQPSFFQQGGIFSAEDISQDLIVKFLELAAEKFRFAEITLNFKNLPIPKDKLIKSSLRNNYILELQDSYPELSANHSTYIKQRLKKAYSFPLVYEKSTDYKSAIRLYKKLYQERLPSFTDKDYRNFEKLCAILSENKRVLIRQVYHAETNELLAVVLLLKDKKRLYNMASSLMPAGKKLLANYCLYNEIIREFAGTALVLDFEGSDVPGIAYFYNKFTSTNEPYPFIRYNRLPAPIRLLKA
jgi:hypothetical protein